ncbi:class I SAM-dependent methyltransferase [Streptomyces luteolus]|uniref:Methyltransferase domain-containing protein n=1 Tax=Streptomyces luteolus TaxID=3043615 RepID=A0ABT6SWR6_9ACTN|nr:class I SAM-dependent methyltransferase [Streptomyces sp. B-S-A12]MDI3419573.1 methyltransferase domain-containing protein [Streptomyces sp. B-S-A12]
MMIDYYSPTAEFYDLLGGQHWAHSDPALASVLADVDTGHGPVLDLGAGTGRATELIARTLPEARILAVEPSPGMRAALTSRAVRDEDLRERVTVVAARAQDVELPERLSAAVICGVLGYLDRAERADLWRRITERLPTGAPIVVELMAVSEPQTVAPVRIARQRLGDQEYEAWMSGKPCGVEQMRWSATWRVLRGGETVREVDVTHDWYTFGLDDLAAETGLTAKQVTPELGVLIG